MSRDGQRGGDGRPVPVDELAAVARGYLSGESYRQIAQTLGYPKPGAKTSGADTVHARLQQIRERTGIGSNTSACAAFLAAPESYALPDHTEARRALRARRQALRDQGLSLRSIAKIEGVTSEAIRRTTSPRS